MKFILFVEGHTERKAIPDFLRRWLDERLGTRAGIQPVRFEGWAEYLRDVKQKARMYLDGPKSADIIAAIGLIDLYGPTFYPNDKATSPERREWGKQYIEGLVGHDRFRHFFAVHEIEAWLFSNVAVLPTEVRAALPSRLRPPEEINFEEPPAKLLDRLYCTKYNRHYKKIVDGKELFGKLDPEAAYAKCPALQTLLDEMLQLARDAGL